ncbi:sunset domain-containing protein, partial [Mycobacterium tuberculosis]
AEPPEPPSAGVRPAIHLPLEDPYQMPNGYPVKASVSFGLYYPPGSALYHDTLAELWFASEEVAQVNGFIRAD